jgi:hypothetical protein
VAPDLLSRGVGVVHVAVPLGLDERRGVAVARQVRQVGRHVGVDARDPERDHPSELRAGEIGSVYVKAGPGRLRLRRLRIVVRARGNHRLTDRDAPRLACDDECLGQVVQGLQFGGQRRIERRRLCWVRDDRLQDRVRSGRGGRAAVSKDRGAPESDECVLAGREVARPVDPVDRVVHRRGDHGIEPRGGRRSDVLHADTLERMLDPSGHRIVVVRPGFGGDGENGDGCQSSNSMAH